MSSGLYSTEKRDFDTTLDLTQIRPYGDRSSFTTCKKNGIC